jgi:hypothetical protein
VVHVLWITQFLQVILELFFLVYLLWLPSFLVAATFFDCVYGSAGEGILSVVRKAVFLGMPAGPGTAPIWLFLPLAYHYLGLQVEYVSYPMERSLWAADTGGTDGAVGSIGLVESTYPHLVLVPTPFTIMSGSLFS